MDISGVISGAGTSQVAAQRSPADVVAGGVEESTDKVGEIENQEGTREAVQAAAQESGVGNSVNIQV